MTHKLVKKGSISMRYISIKGSLAQETYAYQNIRLPTKNHYSSTICDWYPVCCLKQLYEIGPMRLSVHISVVPLQKWYLSDCHRGREHDNPKLYNNGCIPELRTVDSNWIRQEFQHVFMDCFVSPLERSSGTFKILTRILLLSDCFCPLAQWCRVAIVLAIQWIAGVYQQKHT